MATETLSDSLRAAASNVPPETVDVVTLAVGRAQAVVQLLISAHLNGDFEAVNHMDEHSAVTALLGVDRELEEIRDAVFPPAPVAQGVKS